MTEYTFKVLGGDIVVSLPEAEIAALFTAHPQAAADRAERARDAAVTTAASAGVFATVEAEDEIVFLPDQDTAVGTIGVGNGLRDVAPGTGENGKGNTAVGIDAGLSLTTGYYNSYFGWLARAARATATRSSAPSPARSSRPGSTTPPSV